MNSNKLNQLGIHLLMSLMSESNSAELKELSAALGKLSTAETFSSMFRSLGNATATGFHKTSCDNVTLALSIPSIRLMSSLKK